MLSGLSKVELAARLATLQKKGEEIKAEIARGLYSEIVSTMVVRGDRVPVSHGEVALNILRAAWRSTNDELRRRA